MSTVLERADTAQIRELIQPLHGRATDYDRLLERIGDARVVLLGEASHGTHEFYRERAAITRRLIVEKGFTAVAAEADWPDAYRVNRYLHGRSDDRDANEALQDFKRFPTWMWRNTDVLNFVEWLHAHNAQAARPTGFYGLDLYSLHASMQAVLAYLDRTDPDAARRARMRYACFDHYGDDSQAYGYSAASGAESCENEVVAQLVDLRMRAAELLQRDGHVAEDEFFFAEQNARLVRNAEAYYRTMFRGRVNSWNLRDRHMMETLSALEQHLSRRGEPAKIVVWAHNSHLGDARATEMGRIGELNLGQLVREQWSTSCVLIGFSTYSGTVTAADDWDAPGRRMRVRPGLAGSYEGVLHEVGGNFVVPLDARAARLPVLSGPRLQRAIGVVYRPVTERQSHYFEAQLTRQFDAMLHFDVTRAVQPLEPTAGWHGGDLPETYPSGM